jgi:hypothetical protein
MSLLFICCIATVLMLVMAAKREVGVGPVLYLT